MELRHLNYFVTVARTLNFSEASRQLYITQGTLSQQIQQLEGEIGSQLFDRTRHSVVLTEAGEELLPLAIKTIEDSEICSNRMRDLKGALTGTLRIGTTPSFSSLLTETVRKFIREHPGVKLNIQSETAADLIEMLREKKLDLVLAFKPAMAYDELESEPLFKNTLSAVMRKDHPLASHKFLTMEDLENQRIVLPGKSLQARRAFDRYLGLDTRKLNVTLEVNEPNLIMDIVQSTNLITVISSLAAYYRTNLVAIPLAGGNYSMVGCIHRHKEGYRKRSAEIFIEMLRDSAQIERISKSLD
ncbi:MAG: LysR substrate-binding domain-containing protein [Bacteroidales bacterium]|nr:LysR substrate-binding domain-containing protein [Bacteroidales bacterium]